MRDCFQRRGTQSAAIKRRSRCGVVRGCPELSSHLSPRPAPQVGQGVACICFRVGFLACMVVESCCNPKKKNGQLCTRTRIVVAKSPFTARSARAATFVILKRSKFRARYRQDSCINRKQRALIKWHGSCSHNFDYQRGPLAPAILPTICTFRSALRQGS